MTALRDADTTGRRIWWEQRRGVFTLAVAVAYFVTIVLYELYAPPSAGDHIGLSTPALILYAAGGLIWVGVANLIYCMGRLVEGLSKPSNVATYRKHTYATLVTIGVLSYPGWIGIWVVEAWFRNH